jgi:hypothetical protein
MENQLLKICIGVPESHADAVREALGKAGAGKIGNYDFCSFSCKGTGRFRPLKGSNPSIGEIGKIEQVAEEQIQTVCYKSDLAKIIKAIKEVHPYEEPVIDVYPLIKI